MRKVTFLLAICLMVGFVSCSKDEGDSASRKELIGTWVMERYADYIAETGDLLGQGTGEPNLILNNDNTCQFMGYNGTYSTSGNTIIFRYKTSWTDGTHVEEHELSYKIEELTANKLTLSHYFETHLNGNLYSTQCIGYKYYTSK